VTVQVLCLCARRGMCMLCVCVRVCVHAACAVVCN
jgi:hypothetical protein